MKFFARLIVAASAIWLFANFALAGAQPPPIDLGPVKDLQSNKVDTYCAIDANDSVRCWGDSIQEVPNDLGKVKSVSLQYSEVCAITFNSELRCWGLANFGT